jgi:hypothetical protein
MTRPSEAPLAVIKITMVWYDGTEHNACWQPRLCRNMPRLAGMIRRWVWERLSASYAP